jgi:hypothetical protein
MNKEEVIKELDSLKKEMDRCLAYEDELYQNTCDAEAETCRIDYRIRTLNRQLEIIQDQENADSIAEGLKCIGSLVTVTYKPDRVSHDFTFTGTLHKVTDTFALVLGPVENGECISNTLFLNRITKVEVVSKATRIQAGESE